MVRTDNLCCVCNGPCDGTLMRHRTERVRQMISGPDVPYRKDGGPALCHGCQRAIYFRGGLLPYLAREVAKRAKYPSLRKTGDDDFGPIPEPTEDEDLARSRFISWRWPNGEECPRCNSRRIYVIGERKIFKCGECSHQFSATSGTAFASRKLSFVSLLKVLNITTLNASELSRETGLTYKTAWSISERMQ